MSMITTASKRLEALTSHLKEGLSEDAGNTICGSPCLTYVAPETREGTSFDSKTLTRMLYPENLDVMQEMFALFRANPVFHSKEAQGSQVFAGMDYNTTKEEHMDVTFKRILVLRDLGYFKGWLTSNDPEFLHRKAAMHEAIGILDHSMAIKLGVHIYLWGAAVKYLGTKKHHDKWLVPTEEYKVAGCFALTELGHGSNVRGIETVATFDARTQEFVIDTPCESAQKYWIGGAAVHANHAVVFAQLHIGGQNEGVHTFIVPLRDARGRVLPRVRIADCGHKIGLNGVDNGRIWFDGVRVPRDNLLNGVADVLPDRRYQSAIPDKDQRFAALMAPLTGGRVTIAVGATKQSMTGISIAIRYSLSRRAFSLNPTDREETLLLDYPSHQRRMLPLLAKTIVFQFATNILKSMYIHRRPADAKAIHVMSSGYKAMASWHMMRLLQECREAVGGMGIRSDNRIGQLRAEHDVMTTFEGDNNVLMQQVSKALAGDYIAAKRKGKPLAGLGMEYANHPLPDLPSTPNSATLRSTAFQVNLFRLREITLLQHLVMDVQRRVKGGGVSMALAFVEGYQLATDLGVAHAEREALEAIAEAQQKCTDPSIRAVLQRVQSLYVLSTVDENPVFLRTGLLTPVQAQAVHAEIPPLCAALRPSALSLVAALNIPNHLLAPIAFDWVESNSWGNTLEAGLAAAMASSSSTDEYHAL